MKKMIVLMVAFGLLACQKDWNWPSEEWIDGAVIRSVPTQDCGEGYVIEVGGVEYFTLSPILVLLNREFPLCEDSPCPKVPVKLRAAEVKSFCPDYKKMIVVLEIKFR
jgi:hypothetical protein